MPVKVVYGAGTGRGRRSAGWSKVKAAGGAGRGAREGSTPACPAPQIGAEKISDPQHNAEICRPTARTKNLSSPVVVATVQSKLQDKYCRL